MMEQVAFPVSLRSVLGSVVRRNAGKWSRYILAVLKNEADAEDVVQEAVRRVLERNLSFGSEEQIRMYLGRAVGNAAFELYNRRKREQKRHSPIKDETQLPPNTSSPFAWMQESEKSREREQLLGMLEDGLKQLPLKQYEALQLTILDARGISIRDAGARNGIPYSTLRHRSNEGLRRLRRFLEKETKFRSQKSEARSRKPKKLEC